MKKIDVVGLNRLLIEIYDRDSKLTDLEILKEADKAIRRRIMEYESHTDNHLPG